MTTLSKVENRRNDRISLSLLAIVKGKPSRDEFWKETTDLISISRSGAGFYIKKECPVGQLLSLIMPMPRHLRCYDRDKELYRVWGLVQHCSLVSGDGNSGYHVGVAFVGKQSPASFMENPLQSYRISGMNEDGTWKIVEAQTTFVVRRHPRFWMSLDVSLSALDENESIIADESATTDNISISGAAVFSTLNVNVGDSVKLNCKKHDFSALSIVRNRQTSDFELPKLHLEFIDAEFPMEKVGLMKQDGVSTDEKDIFSDETNSIVADEVLSEKANDTTIEVDDLPFVETALPIEEFVKF